MSHCSFTGCGRSGRIFCTIALAAAAFFAPQAASSALAGAAFASSVPVVKTTSGAVSGTTVQNMAAYLGIPYAAAPVGPRRWEPPQPPASWRGTRPAITFAPHCAQAPSSFGVPSTSEDCLYLNVFAPAGTKAGAKLPVMVWIHGGAFVSGESDDYDPDRLVAQHVIVVTLNYRLGHFGFLATTGLDSEPHVHVNYGLLDQQDALAWTHANIAAFGGDPARTTVFGQSAGGASTFAQILSPRSAGLFSRAIIQSGAYDILSLPTLATAEGAGNALAAAAHCGPLDTACLRALTVAQILGLPAGSLSGGGPSPAIDGTFIPHAPRDLLAFGLYNHVPIVQGTNHDEFRLFTAALFDLAGAPPLHPLAAAEYPVAVQETLAASGLGAYTSEVLAQYSLKNYASPDLAYSALATDAAFSTPAYVTDFLLSARTPLYAYEFSDENAPQLFLPPVSFPYGAAHASELQYLYDFFGKASRLSSNQKRLAATMVGYWTRFAASATPNDRGRPLWTPFVGVLDDMISLVPPHPNLFATFVPEHKTLFWAGLTATSGISKSAALRNRYLTIDAARAAARLLRPNTHM